MPLLLIYFFSFFVHNTDMSRRIALFLPGSRIVCYGMIGVIKVKVIRRNNTFYSKRSDPVFLFRITIPDLQRCLFYRLCTLVFVRELHLAVF